MRRLLALLVTLPLLCSCGDDTEPDTDGGPADAGVEALPPDVTVFANAFVETAGVVTAFGAPLAPEAERAHRERGTRTEDGARSSFESAFSGSSVVEPPGCATYDWMRLMGTLGLAGCSFEQLGGVTVDGTVTASLAIDPVTLSLTFDTLMIEWGERSVGASGTVAVAASGEGSPTLHLSGTLALASPEQTATLALTDVTIRIEGDDAVLDGSGSLTAGDVDGSFTMSAVTWPMGSCLPTAGAVTLDDDGVSTTVEFLPETPTTGEVRVQRGALPPVTAALLTPCP